MIATLVPSKIVCVRQYKVITQPQRYTGGDWEDDGSATTTYSYRNTNYNSLSDAISGKTSEAVSYNSISSTRRNKITTQWDNIALVQFPVTSIVGTITSATLKLYPNSDSYNSTSNHSIRQLTQDFDVSTVTWATAPTNTSTGEIALSLPKETWASANVTGLISGYGFRITSSSAARKNFERSGSLAPQLVLEYTPANSIISSITSSVPIDGTTQGTINITRYNSLYTHTCTIKLGNASQTFTGVGTSVNFTLPTAWLAQLPSATRGTAMVTVTTYNGATLIGSPVSASFTATVPSSIVPTASLAAAPVNSNSTVDAWAVYLQGYTRVALTATASAGSGATIVSYTFNGNGVSQTGSSYTVTSSPISTSGTLTYSVTVTDTRGRSTTRQVSISVLSYAPPRVKTVVAKRCTSDGTVDLVNGTYALVTGTIAISSIGARNNVTTKVKYNSTVGATLTSTGAFSVVIGGGTLATTSAYTITVTATDSLSKVGEFSTVLVAAQRALSLGKDNDRARFGGIATDPGLTVDWIAAPVGTTALLRVDSVGHITPITAADALVLLGESHHNLLLNGDFIDPVNQRGQSSYVGSGYNIDMWRNNTSGTITSIQSSGVETLFSAYASSLWGNYQIIPNAARFIGKALTLSAKIAACRGSTQIIVISARDSDDSEIARATASISATGILSTTMSSVPAGTAKLRVGVYASGGASDGDYNVISAYKLEMGDISTLVCDSPVDRSIRLVECQQYLLRIKNDVLGCGYTGGSGGTAYVAVPIPTTMIDTPNLIVYAGTPTYTVRCNGASYTSATAVVTSADDNIVNLKIDSANIPAGHACAAFAAGVGLIQLLSAEP